MTKKKFCSKDLVAISEKVRNKPSILFNKILPNLDVSDFSSKIYTSCPIHGGDNPHGCAIFLDSKPVVTWRCFTNHCEEQGKNIFNLVSQILKIGYYQAVEYVEELYRDENVIILPRQITTEKDVRVPKCYYPSSYFIQRGFSPYTLRRFKVGFCYDKSSPFYGRHIAPLIHKQKCYGIAGRTCWDECSKCGSYHNPEYDCPTYFIPKWKFSKGCSTNSLFYNFSAKNHVKKKSEVILVEGQSDVWRLYEAGYYNVFGLMGGYITEERMNVLKRLGVKRVLLLMDNDEAGRKHEESIDNFLSNFDFQVDSQCVSGKDISDCSIKYLKGFING
jgi:5S rRNA maturation endonuclease (ribonuclease M5)